MFYPTGEPIDSSFSISEASYINDLFFHDLDVDSSGNFVAAWALAKNNSSWELQWQWFNSNGNAITDIEPLSISEDSVAGFSYINIVGNYQSKSLLFWDSNKNNKFIKYAKFLSSDGQQIGSKFRISKNDSANEVISKFLLKDNHIYCIWNASQINGMVCLEGSLT